MQYRSTRNGTQSVSAMEAILQGISPEGGLYVPEVLPRLCLEELKGFAGLTYPDRAAEILSLFLTDYPLADLKECTAQAYNRQTFASERIAPVKALGGGLHILELFHGPTAAFKDMALQLLPRLMAKALRASGVSQKILILTATSGDTGKAALEGFMNVPDTKILVFYPQEGVSMMQRLQMVTQEGGNVSVAAVRGNFDDAQTGVKAILGDPALKETLSRQGYRFSSANSINWGRLVPQIVYYISAYLDLVSQGSIAFGDEINAVVPTGNFGNILAAYYAKQMGLPLHMLICASNDNHVLTDFIRTGVYDRRRRFISTISPSMDILISSNLERLLFELAGREDTRVCQWMQGLSDTGRYALSGEALKTMRTHFWGGYATEGMTRETIRTAYQDHCYILDPHTAVGLCVYEQYQAETGDQRQALLAATASPFKFPKDVLSALQGMELGGEETELLSVLSKASGLPVPAPLAGLKEKPVRHLSICTKEEMGQAVLSFLQEGQGLNSCE